MARHWTRKEYDRLGDLGIFDGEPLELVGGELIVAEPKGTYHVTSVGLVGRALRAALPPGWLVRVQDPIALDDDSEPEPDVAVVPGDYRDYLADHPQRPVLVVEVAETSLAFDRGRKGSLYARGGVQDYYHSVQHVTATGSATLLALPAVRIAVADLLP